MTVNGKRSRLVFAVILLAAAFGARDAITPRSAMGQPPAVTPAKKAQGVAVVGMGQARDDATTAARAIYGSSLRPRGLDELRARILAGDPPPPTASRELKDLAELRAAVNGEDAASRRLLQTIAQQLGVQALLVVHVEESKGGPAPSEDGGSSMDPIPTIPQAPVDPDAGSLAAPPPPSPQRSVVGRLFMVDSENFDAAKYGPDASLTGADSRAQGWRPVVVSLERRFPPAPATVTPTSTAPPPTMRPEAPKSDPFYTSAWFWGAIGAAVLVGGAFYFATRDTSDDPIHLKMRVPR